MIKGIGVDIIELGRIKQSIKRKERFVQRILTQREHDRYETLSEKRKVEYLAGRFAAKEAFAKATGTGIGELGFHDVEILSNETTGAPVMSAKGYENEQLWVSISHSTDHAIAQVVLEEC
ncbi:holo-[acyl-carrier-protein] synthase [Halobacillus karajensis]|uniref:Holo-[acyl-carrier-protein] synthase n=1 Tax=Halobacillus karajensis TaxID=195088 RepID=A0A024P9N2_9BACI|nr:holo-ACP synthase [Halobacillus karajensis]CDQ21506.1 Holo-[acyl-carrier-protein] synthase [Halobacillus karajensis]CDQ25441.1 Holo-[acyl-carrier-protein] synthase [Halobacillus karajensis]CDQ29028.1 Holo-[acyl-carrier-protein] synthase [Halobacillus karajensis]SEI09399.1 holo-[acyl-carrier-protein] synthase [Halobacillus karajensis]